MLNAIKITKVEAKVLKTIQNSNLRELYSETTQFGLTEGRYSLAGSLIGEMDEVGLVKHRDLILFLHGLTHALYIEKSSNSLYRVESTFLDMLAIIASPREVENNDENDIFWIFESFTNAINLGIGEFRKKINELVSSLHDLTEKIKNDNNIPLNLIDLTRILNEILFYKEKIDRIEQMYCVIFRQCSSMINDQGLKIIVESTSKKGFEQISTLQKSIVNDAQANIDILSRLKQSPEIVSREASILSTPHVVKPTSIRLFCKYLQLISDKFEETYEMTFSDLNLTEFPYDDVTKNNTNRILQKYNLPKI